MDNKLKLRNKIAIKNFNLRHQRILNSFCRRILLFLWSKNLVTITGGDSKFYCSKNKFSTHSPPNNRNEWQKEKFFNLPNGWRVNIKIEIFLKLNDLPYLKIIKFFPIHVIRLWNIKVCNFNDWSYRWLIQHTKSGWILTRSNNSTQFHSRKKKLSVKRGLDF
jgi:hypothetical protein